MKEVIAGAALAALSMVGGQRFVEPHVGGGQHRARERELMKALAVQQDYAHLPNMSGPTYRRAVVRDKLGIERRTSLKIGEQRRAARV
jgi:hypothetical protein